MLRIHQLKLPVPHTVQDLEDKIRKILRIRPGDLSGYEIVKNRWMPAGKGWNMSM